MERYRTLEGLLIGRKPLPGGDVILSFVTPEGAMQAVARKAMRPTGRSGRLSLFHHLRFQVYQKPGNDLSTLTQAELRAWRPHPASPTPRTWASWLSGWLRRRWRAGSGRS
jgi:DNA repair protein RecO (recombination protein O)